MQKTEYLVSGITRSLTEKKMWFWFDVGLGHTDIASLIFFLWLFTEVRSKQHLSLTTSKMVSASDQQNAQSMSYTRRNIPLVVQLQYLSF